MAKEAIFYVVAKQTAWRSEYEIMAVTSAQGREPWRQLNGRVIARTDKGWEVVRVTRKTSRECYGEFATAEQAEEAMGLLRTAIENTNHAIRHAQQQLAAAEQERANVIAAVLSKYKRQ